MMKRSTRTIEHAEQLEFEIPKQLLKYTPTAIMRLEYLYADVTFTYDDVKIIAESPKPIQKEQLTKEIAHSLYREKIYQETLPARLALVRTLTQG